MEESSIDKLLRELREESGPPIISEEEYRRAEKEINKEMEEFGRKWRLYMQQSRESARRAYLNY